MFAGIGTRVCDEAVQRTLKEADLAYLHSHKKGLLKKKDRRNLVKFSRNISKPFDEKLWTKSIAFYFDDTSFAQKYNPFDEARSTRSVLSLLLLSLYL